MITVSHSAQRTLQPQTGPLHREHRGVGEGDQAHLMDSLFGEAAEPDDPPRDEIVLESVRTSRQPGEDPRHERRIVQPQLAPGREEQNNHFHQLVERNGAQHPKARQGRGV